MTIDILPNIKLLLYVLIFYRLFTEITSSVPALNYDAIVSKNHHGPSVEQTYIQCALKLLDLLDTLYLRTGKLFINNETVQPDDGVSEMWHTCWCPLLEVCYMY